MDHEEFVRLKARLAALAADEPHPQVPCGGVVGRCPHCIALYRAAVGDKRPTCLVCDGEHFAYEPHWAADATTAVVLGFAVEQPMLLRYPRGDEGGQ